MTMGQYLLFKKTKIEEDRRNEDQRFKKKVELKLQEIAAINNLADAIKALANNTNK